MRSGWSSSQRTRVFFETDVLAAYSRLTISRATKKAMNMLQVIGHLINNSQAIGAINVEFTIPILKMEAEAPQGEGTSIT